MIPTAQDKTSNRRPEAAPAAARAALPIPGRSLPFRAPRRRRFWPAPSVVVALLVVLAITLGDIPWSTAPPAAVQALEKREKQERREKHKHKDKKLKQKKEKKRETRDTRETAETRAMQDVIVVLKPGSDPEQVAADVGADPTQIYDHVISGFAAEVSPAEIGELENLPAVAAIVPDYPVEAYKYKTARGKKDRVAAEGRDARGKCKKKDKQNRKQCLKKARKRTSQPTLTTSPPPSSQPNQVIPTGVARIDADGHPLASIARDGGTVDTDVAVLDTGIAAHPDLNVAGGVSCVEDNPSYTDDNGHGTHVAGTIGALDNAIGVVGVAPGARLWAVKVLDARGDGFWSTVICGLDWVAENSDTIDVVNMSLGGPGSDGVCQVGGFSLHDVVCTVVEDAGIPVIVAAGNESQDAANAVPAAYGEVITVSAFADFDGAPGGQGAPTCQSGGDDTFASFSNFGADVDIAAPGVCIRSTAPGGGYAVLSGTSMAAPHVTGAAALYLAATPAATPDDVRDWLLTAASRPRDSSHGFSGDPDAFAEPVLFLGAA